MGRKKLLLSKAVENYLLALSTEGRSDWTIQNYRYSLERFLAHVGDQYVADLDETHVRSFVEHEKNRPLARINNNDKRQKEYSVHKRYSVVRSFVRWLYTQRYIDFDFVSLTKPPKVAAVMPDALTDEEVRRIMRTKLVTQNFRNKVIVELFLGTGLRLAELANLKVDDVDLNDRTIQVLGKGKKYALVPISPRLRQELYRYIYDYREPRHEDETALFLTETGTAMTRYGVQTLIRRILREAGIERKVGPHLLRHTFATNFLRDGGNLEALRRILRHSDIKTTAVYTHLQIADLKAQISQFDPLDRLNKR